MRNSGIQSHWSYRSLSEFQGDSQRTRSTVSSRDANWPAQGRLLRQVHREFIERFIVIVRQAQDVSFSRSASAS